MNNIANLNRCSGCGACVQICPVGAIEMQEDPLFFRPAVDPDKCRDCGLCLRCCPVEHPRQQEPIRSAWAAVHKDPQTVRGSSSGGAFSALAQTVLDRSGVVFGACFQDHFRRVKMIGTDQVSLHALRKSKYVESSTGDSFRQVKQLLAQGRPVLYVGTPCQIAGLKGFLGKEDENLLTCDFSCGGLSSHKLFESYLQTLEACYGSQVTDVDFRPKTLGWENYAVRVRFANGRVYHRAARLDPYMHSFLYRHYTTGELCLQCPFSDNHYADLILADFWKHRQFPGWEKPGQGISLILATTQKGETWLQEASQRLQIAQLDTEKAGYNIKKTETTDEHKERRAHFLQQCGREGLWAAAKMDGMPTGIRALKISAKAFARRILRSKR